MIFYYMRSHSLDSIHKDTTLYWIGNAQSELILKVFIENQRVTSNNPNILGIFVI
jgi:hypothetical protein